jgi:hypothetical protein
MHGPSFNGDTVAALHALADDYDRRARQALHGSGTPTREQRVA